MTEISKLLNTFVFIMISGILFQSCQKKLVEDESIVPDWNIQGGWVQRGICPYFSSSYVQGEIIYSADGTFSQTIDSFTDSNCFNKAFTQRITGNYVTSENNSISDPRYGYVNIDSTLGTYEVTPASTTVANSFNTSNFCGFSDWAMNIAKSIVGRACGTATMPSVGAIEYSVLRKNFTDFTVSIPGFTDQNFYNGDMMLGTSSPGFEGTTPSTRHEVTNGNISFIRQF